MLIDIFIIHEFMDIQISLAGPLAEKPFATLPRMV